MSIVSATVYAFLLVLSCTLCVLCVAVAADGDFRSAWQFMSVALASVFGAGLIDVLGQRS